MRTHRYDAPKLGLQQPAMAAGLIEMAIPDKRNSRLQYRLSAAGRALIAARRES